MKALKPSLCIVLFLASANLLHAQAPSYTKDVRPFLDKFCIECHQGNKAKAGVRLDSFDSIMKASKKGRKIVVAGQADKSQLVTCVEGTGGKKMPPKKAVNQPTDKDIKVLREWVNGGAKDDTPKQSRLENGIEEWRGTLAGRDDNGNHWAAWNGQPEIRIAIVTGSVMFLCELSSSGTLLQAPSLIELHLAD